MAQKPDSKIATLEKENQALKKQVELLLEKIAQKQKLRITSTSS